MRRLLGRDISRFIVPPREVFDISLIRLLLLRCRDCFIASSYPEFSRASNIDVIPVIVIMIDVVNNNAGGGFFFIGIMLGGTMKRGE